MYPTYFRQCLIPWLFVLLAPPLCAQIRINEYSCANLDQFADNYGKHEDWIELYNAGPDSVDLGGYFLSDNKDKPRKWAVPAGTWIPGNGFRLFWASGRDTGIHTNFKLTQTKNNPETIVLAVPSGAVIDQIKINKTKSGQSRGRSADGGPEWSILTQPSPLKTNSKSPHYRAFADRPDFSAPAGFYPDSVTIALQNNAPGAALYYTLDGSEPGPSSALYTGPISLKTTTVLKALAISPDSTVLPGFVEYATYFIRSPHTLPVVSVAGAKLEDLANGNSNLLPVGSIEYFNAAGERTARAYGEFNRHGQDSWVNDQRSIDLIARDEMGYNNALHERIFAMSDRDEYQRLILRAAGDDNYPGNFLPAHKGCAHLRDAYVHNLAKRGGLNLDVRLSEKAIVYIDGKYWGVYDLREIPDDHDYTDYYYGQDKYHLQYILTWGDTWAEYGGAAALSDWDSLYAFIISRPMSNQANFNHVDSLLDVKSLVDYVLVNSLTVCSDWLNYNTGWWRGLDPAGAHRKWGYILWDNDATFGYYINYTQIPDTSASALPCNPESLPAYSDPRGHTKVLRRLLANPQFKQYYVSRYIDLMNTVFSCDNMLAYLDTVANRVAPEMGEHTARWGGSVDDWQKNVDRLRAFIIRRCEALAGGMVECYDLKGPYPVTFNADPDSLAGLQINSQFFEPDELPFSGNYFGGVDLKLSVRYDSSLGYRFDRWLAAQNSALPNDSAESAVFQLTSADTITAHFIPIPTATLASQAAGAVPALRVTPTVFGRGGATLTLDIPEAAALSLRLIHLAGGEALPLTGSGQLFLPGRYALRLAPAAWPAGLYVLEAEGSNGFRQQIKLVYAP